MLSRHGVELVIDVGANSGQYAQAVRGSGYRNSIISFEPLSGPFADLSAAARSDPSWDVRRLALGNKSGVATLNVAGNRGASSSFLPMLPVTRSAAPAAAYVGTEEVQVATLDSVVTPGTRCTYLKADVQGYEREVLEGGRKVLSTAIGVEIELSFMPVYLGGPSADEMTAYLDDAGFSLADISPMFWDPKGLLLQADAIFLRHDPKGT